LLVLFYKYVAKITFLLGIRNKFEQFAFYLRYII